MQRVGRRVVRDVHGCGSESTTAAVQQRQHSQKEFAEDGASEWRTTSSDSRTHDQQGCLESRGSRSIALYDENGVGKFCIKMKVARSENEVLTNDGNWRQNEAHRWHEFRVFPKTGDVWRVAANSGGRRPMHHRERPSPSRTRSQPHRHWFIRKSPRLSPSVPQKPLSSAIAIACSTAQQTTPQILRRGSCRWRRTLRQRGTAAHSFRSNSRPRTVPQSYKSFPWDAGLRMDGILALIPSVDLVTGVFHFKVTRRLDAKEVWHCSGRLGAHCV